MAYIIYQMSYIICHISHIMYYNILYYIILHYIILCYILFVHFILYYFILYYSYFISFYIIPFYLILYYLISYYIVYIYIWIWIYIIYKPCMLPLQFHLWSALTGRCGAGFAPVRNASRRGNAWPLADVDLENSPRDWKKETWKIENIFVWKVGNWRHPINILNCLKTKIWKSEWQKSCTSW